MRSHSAAMAGKVAASQKVARPNPEAPPRDGGKPKADWPTTKSTLHSGLASPTITRGPQPSRDAPGRDFASNITREEFRGRR
jgi:hypothetical protein